MPKKIKIKSADKPIAEPVAVESRASLASELKAAYTDARDLVTVWRAMQMGYQLKQKRDRLLAVLDAIAQTEG